jgi:hypothetical protein
LCDWSDVYIPVSVGDHAMACTLLRCVINLARQCVAKEACVNKRRDTGSISTYFFPALSLAIAAVGCAGQTPAAHDARAAGEWTFRLPETGSPYAGLAIASPGQQTGLNMVDDALAAPAAKTETAATPKARPAPAPRTVVAQNTHQPAAAPASQPTAATAPPSLPAVASAQPEQLALNTPPVPDARDEMRYSEREQQSQKQRDFRGGDAVVISASALVIILLIVVLILLLT